MVEMQKFDAKYWPEYEWFNSDNNKKCISSNAVMKNMYNIVNQCYEAKGW